MARPHTTVVIVSGRTVETLARKVPVPGVSYVGNHGMELIVDGEREEDSVATQARPAIARLGAALAQLVGTRPDVVLERKGISLCVHTRLVQDERAREALEAEVCAMAAAETTLESYRGKRIVEIRPRGARHKGDAILHVLRAAHGEDWDADCNALFVGDDVTDEDGFRALGGRGIGVRVTDGADVESAAGYEAKSVDDALGLLEALAGVRGSGKREALEERGT